MIVYQARDLACVRGGRLVFQDVSFDLVPGAALRVVGPNGSGKSSLLRLIAGLSRPFDGRCGWRREADDDGRDPIALIGHANGQKPALTPLEDLTFWARLADRREAPARARLALEGFGLAPLADTPQRYLSQGQKRRAALARLLVAPSRLWLLDEPTVGLDSGAVGLLEGQVRRHLEGGGMVVASTHLSFDLPDAATLDMADHQPAEAW
ncbi:MAG: heme ABC exporter ATP-binding protein CcmA [Azospirillaceae bacterium]